LKILASHAHLWHPHAKFSVTAHNYNDSVPCCLLPYLSFTLGWSLSTLSFIWAHQLYTTKLTLNIAWLVMHIIVTCSILEK